MKLTGKQLATVLAALRHWQMQTDEDFRVAVVPEYFDEHDPLDDDEIDELCEELNCE